MSHSENPCLACSVDQRCCKVPGLKLSKQEYERHFRQYSDRFSVVRYNKMLIVYPREDNPCPYWDEDGCSIHKDRPVDCRLYPYELHRMVEKSAGVEVELYDQTDCPLKEILYLPVDEAKALVRALVREVYGPGKPVHIKYQPGKKPPRTFGIFNPLIAKLSRLIRTRRL